MHHLFQPHHRQDSDELDLSWQIDEGTPGLDHHPQAGIGTLLIGVSAPQCSLHKEERALKVLPKTRVVEAKEAATEHTS